MSSLSSSSIMSINNNNNINNNNYINYVVGSNHVPELAARWIVNQLLHHAIDTMNTTAIRLRNNHNNKTSATNSSSTGTMSSSISNPGSTTTTINNTTSTITHNSSSSNNNNNEKFNTLIDLFVHQTCIITEELCHIHQQNLPLTTTTATTTVIPAAIATAIATAEKNDTIIIDAMVQRFTRQKNHQQCKDGLACLKQTSLQYIATRLYDHCLRDQLYNDLESKLMKDTVIKKLHRYKYATKQVLIHKITNCFYVTHDTAAAAVGTTGNSSSTITATGSVVTDAMKSHATTSTTTTTKISATNQMNNDGLGTKVATTSKQQRKHAPSQPEPISNDAFIRQLLSISTATTTTTTTTFSSCGSATGPKLFSKHIISPIQFIVQQQLYANQQRLKSNGNIYNQNAIQRDHHNVPPVVNAASLATIPPPPPARSQNIDQNKVSTENTSSIAKMTTNATTATKATMSTTKTPVTAKQSNPDTTPQTPDEHKIVSTLCNEMNFDDSQEILSSYRKLLRVKAKSIKASTTTIPSKPTADDVMMDIIMQREEADEAKKMDEGRLLSELSRKEESKRRREIIQQEFRKTMEECTNIDELMDPNDKRLYSNSWILHNQSLYSICQRYIITGPNVMINDDNDDDDDISDIVVVPPLKLQFLELLQLEKNSRKWYGEILPKSYFMHYVIERLKQSATNVVRKTTNAQQSTGSRNKNSPDNLPASSLASTDAIIRANLLQQTQDEIAALQSNIYDLSKQVGGVPKIFRDAHDKHQLFVIKENISSIDNDNNNNNDPVTRRSPRANIKVPSKYDDSAITQVSLLSRQKNGICNPHSGKKSDPLSNDETTTLVEPSVPFLSSTPTKLVFNQSVDKLAILTSPSSPQRKKQKVAESSSATKTSTAPIIVIDLC